MEYIEERSATLKEVKEICSIIFQDEIIKLLNLGEKDVEVLKMKWVENKTFEEIARHFALTKSRIGQIYKRATGRIKLQIIIGAQSYKKHKEIIEENKILCTENRLYKRKFDKLNLTGEKKEILSSVYKTPIDRLDLSVRAINCLRFANIETIGDIMEYRKKDLILFYHLGKKTAQEIVGFLKNEYGLELK